MRLYRFLVQNRLIMTVLLAIAGIATMIYYASCDTACSYLRGDLLGIDLKYIGIAYMAMIIILALFRQADLIRMLVAAGIGVEVFLVSFQVTEDVFCPFCLTFGILVLCMYFVNYERSAGMNHWYQKLIYMFGDAKFPFIQNQSIPLLAMMIVGYLFVCFTFSGSATPSYAEDYAGVPSYGNGAWVAASKAENIALKIINPEPFHAQWPPMIERSIVEQTPACILRFSSAYLNKYDDSEQISTELIPELQNGFPRVRCEMQRFGSHVFPIDFNVCRQAVS